MEKNQPGTVASPMPLKPITNVNSGTCQAAQKRLRTRAAARALLPVCSLGSAKPRQPTSSPEPYKTMLATQYGKRPRKANSSERPNSPRWGHPPNKRRQATAARRNRIGVPSTATTHHPSPTRQRNTRPSNSRTPADSPLSAVTTKAETMGPRPPARWKRADDVCRSEAPRERNTAGAHTPHEKAYASAKKSTKGYLRASGLTTDCVCGPALS